MYLLTSLSNDGENPLLLIPLLFLLNTFFFWGELFYLFALSVFFFYCGYLFRRIYRSEPINWWIVGFASIAMFFFHFLPYATAILVALTLIFAESRTELLSPFAISFAPSIALTIWYAVKRVFSKADRPGLDVLDTASICRSLDRGFLSLSGVPPLARNSISVDEGICITQPGRSDRSDSGGADMRILVDKDASKVLRSTCIRSSLRNRSYRYRL